MQKFAQNNKENTNTNTIMGYTKINIFTFRRTYTNNKENRNVHMYIFLVHCPLDNKTKKIISEQKHHCDNNSDKC